jgi:hypothetical protein
MRQGLDNAREFMQGQGGEQVMAALREAVRDTLHLSQEHENIIQRTERLNTSRSNFSSQPTNPAQRELAVREQALSEGVNALTQTLQDLSDQEIQIPLELMWGLRDAADGLRRGSRALEENEVSRSLPIQRQALADLNKTALQMLATMDAMNSQMNASGMQNAMEQLEQLAQQQGGLNRLAEQIQEQLRRQGTSPSAQQSLERMAFEQSLIREATERLNEKLQRMKEMLGDLSDVGSEMKQVETRLGANELNRQVLEQMRRIETRMLESSKSLQQRETGKSRKSLAAKRLFGEQAGTENAEWNKIRDLFQGELSNLSEADAPEAYRPLIRAYYRALAEQKGMLGGSTR